VSSERTTWRRCASLMGAAMGPEGPITWLPTLNRVREGLLPQALMRVVTDTVTTLAGDVDVRGVVRRAVSSAGSRAHHTSRAVAGRFTHGDDDRCGARWPLPVVSLGCRSSRHPVAPWELAWRPIYARSGSSRDVRSPMTGRASSSDDAARTRWCYFSALRLWPGRSLQCAYRAPRPGISTRGPARGLARKTPKLA